MNNVIILGSGRSGTSLVAGILSRAGYFMGDHLLEPSPSNPKGYFESYDIEAINEMLLRPVVKTKPTHFRRFFKKRLGKGQFWLAKVGMNKKIQSSPMLNSQIQRLTCKTPFCFKDPRFSYTLPIWRPYLPENTVLICVFRHPAITITSILKECRDRTYLHDLKFNFQDGLEVWKLMYQHILTKHCHEGTWVFVHFEQLLTMEGIMRLAEFTNADVDSSFPEASLKRSFSDENVPQEQQKLYKKLCHLAGML